MKKLTIIICLLFAFNFAKSQEEENIKAITIEGKPLYEITIDNKKKIINNATNVIIDVIEATRKLKRLTEEEKRVEKELLEIKKRIIFYTELLKLLNE